MESVRAKGSYFNEKPAVFTASEDPIGNSLVFYSAITQNGVIGKIQETEVAAYGKDGVP